MQYANLGEKIGEFEDIAALMPNALESTSVFYISTTASYALQNRFEYGGTKSIKELTRRMQKYNVGRAEGDLMFVAEYYIVNDYSCIENRIGRILDSFRDKKGGRKEMLIINIDYLIGVVEGVVNNFSQEVQSYNDSYEDALAAGRPLTDPGEIDVVMRQTDALDEKEMIEELIDIIDFVTDESYQFVRDSKTTKLTLSWVNQIKPELSMFDKVTPFKYVLTKLRKGTRLKIIK
jgi:hypothetical protein